MRRVLRGASLLAIAASLSACASITRGTSQTMAINSSPQGADCTLVREGEIIGRVAPTPGQATVDKSRRDITVNCSLSGYRDGSYVAASEAEMMTAGNVVFGGVVGLAVDAGTGAINKYPSNVTVVLQREDPPAPPAATPSAAPAEASGPLTN